MFEQLQDDEFVYAWERACLKAVVETDNTKMRSRIAAARSAIAGRLHDDGAMSVDERQEIYDALRGLEVLEKERVPLN